MHPYTLSIQHIWFCAVIVYKIEHCKIMKEIEEERKSQFISDLAEAFDDVKLHEQGKKKLKIP